MRKIILSVLFVLSVSAVHAANIKQIIVGPEGRLQFYPKISSLSISDLGTITLVSDEGVIIGSAAYMNFVGAGVTASCVGSTCTITIPGGGVGGSSPDAFANPISTRPLTATSGIDASSGTFTSSVTAYGGFYSTSGFTGGGSTFTTMALERSGTAAKPAISFGVDAAVTNRLGIYSSASNNLDFAMGDGISAMNWSQSSISANKIFQALNGTILAPGLYYSGDQSAGITCFGAAPTRCAITTTGGDRMRWNSTGQFTVGKQNFQGWSLYVGSNTAASDELLLNVSYGITSPKFQVTRDTAGVNVDFTFSSGAVVNSSFTVVSGTVGINGVPYVWPSTPPAQGQHLVVNTITGADNYLTWGGDGGGGGGGSATIPPGTECQNFMAVNLISGGTNYALYRSTISLAVGERGLIPNQLYGFSDSTTQYMRLNFLTHHALKLDGNATFYATVIPKTPAASRKVQLAFVSTGNVNGTAYSYTVTTAAVFDLPTFPGERKTVKWSARVTDDLFWTRDMDVESGFTRMHNDPLLVGTQLVGELWWLNGKVCYNYDQ